MHLDGYSAVVVLDENPVIYRLDKHFIIAVRYVTNRLTVAVGQWEWGAPNHAQRCTWHNQCNVRFMFMCHSNMFST